MKLKHGLFALALLSMLTSTALPQDADKGKLPYLWNELTSPGFCKGR